MSSNYSFEFILFQKSFQANITFNDNGKILKKSFAKSTKFTLSVIGVLYPPSFRVQSLEFRKYLTRFPNMNRLICGLHNLCCICTFSLGQN